MIEVRDTEEGVSNRFYHHSTGLSQIAVIRKSVPFDWVVVEVAARASVHPKPWSII